MPAISPNSAVAIRQQRGEQNLGVPGALIQVRWAEYLPVEPRGVIAVDMVDYYVMSIDRLRIRRLGFTAT